MTGDEKHAAAATSTLDVLWVLYDRVLRVDPRRPDDPDRDRFLLSKGHGPMAYYAVLAAKGFLAETTCSRLRAASTRRSATTPTAPWCPGWRSPRVRSATGSRLAVGTALGLRAQAASAPGSSCWSATPSWTRAATTEAIQLRRTRWDWPS